MDCKRILEELCGCTAPSGFEEPAVRIASRLLEPLVDEMWVDRMGNLIGVHRCGHPNAKKLLLDAHLDEIGLLVTGVDKGFLRFRAIGGVDSRMLPGREVWVLTQPPTPGVVACQPSHLCDSEAENKSIPLSDLYIDVGLSQKQVEARIPVGTPVVYRGSCFSLGKEQMCGKAMDDRSCFTVLLRAMELLEEKELDVDVYVMGSTREEVSGAGATVGTWAVQPDCCVAVDVTHGRTPDGPAEKTFVLGNGPAIGVGPNMTRWMTRRILDKAQARDIPYQQEIMSGHTGTNGWEMQISREGVATSVLSLPLKYMHTPIETLSLRDLEQTALLLAAFTEDLGKEWPL